MAPDVLLVQGYMRRALFSLGSENALRRPDATIDPGFFRPGVSVLALGRKNPEAVA